MIYINDFLEILNLASLILYAIVSEKLVTEVNQKLYGLYDLIIELTRWLQVMGYFSTLRKNTECYCSKTNNPHSWIKFDSIDPASLKGFR